MDESNNYVKVFELMNKNEAIHSSLITTIAKLLVIKSRSQFRLLDDPDSYHWNDYITNTEKVTLYDDELLFRETGVVFALKGDFLSMITD